MAQTSTNKRSDGGEGPTPEIASPLPGITMWGAPGSGKTTFLAALNIAMMRDRRPWRVVGADNPSTDFLAEKTDALSQERRFPNPTEALDRLRWVLIGEPEQVNGRRWRKAPNPTVKIDLNLLDPPGGAFLDRDPVYGNFQRALIENLTSSRGIVFLYDPIREFRDGDAFKYLNTPLTRLAAQMLNSGDFPDGRLPHHVAVCITKFDDVNVLGTAEHLGLVTTDPDDPHSFPRVDDGEDAKALFEELCLVSASGSAEMARNALDQYFRPERVRFFVTSSIGFYFDRRKNTYDREDFQNLIPERPRPTAVPDTSGPPRKEYRIRGQVRPINVVEPLLWLGQQIYGEMSTESGR